LRHVVFRLEKDRYALPLAAIREVVVPPEKFTRVPRAPRVVSGVMNLRGRVVTVVDLRALLGLDVSGADRERGDRVVILDRGRRDLGLLVSDVDGMETIEKVTAAPGRQSTAVRGVARLRGWAVTVLDPDGIDGMVVESFGSVSPPAGR
jgi:purine-binding chemotaxis protein CheW